VIVKLCLQHDSSDSWYLFFNFACVRVAIVDKCTMPENALFRTADKINGSYDNSDSVECRKICHRDFEFAHRIWENVTATNLADTCWNSSAPRLISAFLRHLGRLGVMSAQFLYIYEPHCLGRMRHFSQSVFMSVYPDVWNAVTV